MNKNAGRKWPIIIAVSTIVVIGFGVATVKIAMNNPVEMSDYGMQNYHEYDRDANDIIDAKIAFDQKYTIAFVTPQISENGTVIEYSIADKAGNAVNNAKVEVILTRPDTTKSDISLTEPSVNNGKYTFDSVVLPKLGRWDILAKISIGNDQRYYNIKADTRSQNTIEF